MEQESTRQLVHPTDITFHHDIAAVTDPQYANTFKHVFVMTGEIRFTLNGHRYFATDTEGVLLLSGYTMRDIETSADFTMSSVFVEEGLLRVMLPTPQYGTQMVLAQMVDPVMHMTKAQHDLAVAVMAAIKERFEMRDHLFYYEVLKRTVQTAILDNYHIFASRRQGGMLHLTMSQQIFHKFIKMLQAQEFVRHRNIDYYAEQLFITPKYLSELCVKASEHSARYWIDFFTSTAIACELQNPDRTISEIAEQFCFSTLAYFSNYVKSHFGVGPQEYRRQTTIQSRT